MLFLHTADWHLGKVLHETSMIADQEFVLDHLIQELGAHPYDALLIAGDIFDRSVPPPEAVTLWDETLVRLRRAFPTLAIIVIPGNHDSAPRLAYASRFLNDQNIHIRTVNEDLAVPITLNRGELTVDFFAVPWLAGSSQRDLWEDALTKLDSARRPQRASVVVAHLFTMGGSESDSERIFVGESEQIPADWLSGWDYVALGHLHTMQQPGPTVWYPGSPLAYSFSEAGTESDARVKSWLRVELAQGTTTVTPVAIPAAHPLTRLRGSYEDFLTQSRWAPFEHHYVELWLTDAALVSQPMDRLRLRFPYLLSLHQEATSTQVATGDLPRAQVAGGSLAQDAQRFLQDVLPGVSPLSLQLVVTLAREVGHEAP